MPRYVREKAEHPDHHEDRSCRIIDTAVSSQVRTGEATVKRYGGDEEVGKSIQSEPFVPHSMDHVGARIE
jgi:hypothetical protein